jgi:hypothetical protein
MIWPCESPFFEQQFRLFNKLQDPQTFGNRGEDPIFKLLR